MITPAVLLLAGLTSTAVACALLGKPRASHYRDRKPVPLVPAQRAPRAAPPNALTVAEQDAVITVLTSPRFCDKSVAQTWATLLDEGVYLASMSTMHRLLRLIGQSGDRRDQAAHPARARPELMATKPGQVWSWDITKLRGPERGVYYDLYVILDIYSRYVVGWTVAAREDADIAKDLIESAAQIHGAPASLHADRGTSMTSKTVAQLLVDLNVARSHSRPHVSNDNPYSEAAFADLEVRPRFPRQLRIPGRRAGVLRGVLRLLQPRASAQRHRTSHRRVGPLRHRHRDPTAAPDHPARGLRREPRPLPAPPTRTPEAPRSRVDQPAQPGGPHPEQLDTNCLKLLDTFRCASASGSRPTPRTAMSWRTCCDSGRCPRATSRRRTCGSCGSWSGTAGS